MTKYKIYQIKNSRDVKYSFMWWDYASEYFSIKDYNVVYDGTTDDNLSLEDLFMMFNRIDQESTIRLEMMGFKGHSLSVSDVVELNGTMYYCDSFGWKEIRA